MKKYTLRSHGKYEHILHFKIQLPPFLRGFFGTKQRFISESKHDLRVIGVSFENQRSFRLPSSFPNELDDYGCYFQNQCTLIK